MTIEILLLVIAVGVLFATSIALHCIRVADKRKKRRNAVEKLYDNARFGTDCAVKRRFKRALGLLVGSDYVRVKTLRKVAMVFVKTARRVREPIDKAYCLSWAGRCYEDYGDPVLAAICYTAAIEVAPSETFSSERLGDYYLEYSPEEAQAHYERVLEYNPLTSTTYFKLAKLHSKHGDSDKAIARYKTAIDANNGYVASMAEVAIESAKKGDKKTALNFYFMAMANDVCEFEELEEAIKECLIQCTQS